MKQKILNAIKHFLPLVIIGLVLGVCIYNINATMLMDNPMPMPFGIGCSVVLTGSMDGDKPDSLKAGDLIIVKKTDEFREQQVVVFQDKNSLTVHRIIKIDGEEITTQGDANNTADDPITKEAIKGEVIFSIPYFGYVLDVLRHPIVTIAVLGVAVYLMFRSFKSDSSEREQGEKDELDELKKEIEELTNELKNKKSE